MAMNDQFVSKIKEVVENRLKEAGDSQNHHPEPTPPPALLSEREIRKTPEIIPTPPPPAPLRQSSNLNLSRQRTKLQTIAEFTSQLPFREAMIMARGILGKIKDPSSLTEEQLSAAIQDWAWEGETFIEERRPGLD
jgi:hypothetical protein